MNSFPDLFLVAYQLTLAECPSNTDLDNRQDFYRARIGGSNRLDYQASRPAVTSHGVPLANITLRIGNKFRMEAVSANFFAFST